MINSKECQDIQASLPRLRNDLLSKSVEKMSQLLRAYWITKPEQRAKDPKLLGQEMEGLDLWAPFVQAATEILSENPEMKKSFFDYPNPGDKWLELTTRYLIEVERGEDPNKDEVKAIIEQTLSQEEPPKEIKELMEELKDGEF